MTTEPATYTDGLGELIRAHRTYLGLSPAGMATQLGMSERSYDRIEKNQRACPPGLLDSIRALEERFEAAVDKVLDTTDGEVEVEASSSHHDWKRAVVGRAAVASGGGIIPRLKTQC